MFIGWFLLFSGLVLTLYAYYQYKKNNAQLGHIKQKDLVSFYLDLALSLTPVPFWSVIIGLVLVFIGILILLINFLISTLT